MTRTNALRLSSAFTLFSALILFGFENSSSAQETAEAPTSIQFPSGSVGGGFYKVAGVIGKELESELGIPVSVMPSSGSGENINLMEKGEVQMALASANTLWPAFNSTLQYDGREYENFRLVGKLYENPTLLYALESSGITSIEDLKGKRVAVGSSPSAFDHITRPILEEHGIDYDGDIKKVYVGFGDAATQLSDGLIDASIATVGMPAVQQVASQNKVNYLTWRPGAIDSLASKYPFFSRVTTDPQMLPGYEGEPYETMDMGGPYLVVHKDLPDEFVYRVAKVLHDNISDMSESAIELRDAAENTKMLATPLGDVPFHPGAERFWEEQGLQE